MKLTSKTLNRLIKEALDEVGENEYLANNRLYNQGVQAAHGWQPDFAKTSLVPQQGKQNPEPTPKQTPVAKNDGLKGPASGGVNPAKAQQQKQNTAPKKTAMPTEMPVDKKGADKAIATLGPLGNTGWRNKAKAAGWTKQLINRCTAIFNHRFIPEPERWPSNKAEYDAMLEKAKKYGYKSLEETAEKCGWNPETFYNVDARHIDLAFTDPSYTESMDGTMLAEPSKQSKPAQQGFDKYGRMLAGMNGDDGKPLAYGLEQYGEPTTLPADSPIRKSEPSLVSSKPGMSAAPTMNAADKLNGIQLKEARMLSRIVKEATIRTLKQLLK